MVRLTRNQLKNQDMTPVNPEVERITLKHILASIRSVLNLEKGVFFTFKEFLLKPKKATEEYLFTTERKKYMDPIKYSFLAVTIYTLIMYYFVDMENMFPTSPFGKGNSETDKFINEKIGIMMELMSKYMNVIMLLSVPVFAFFTHLIYNTRLKKWYYMEHVAINLFVAGNYTFLCIPFLFLYSFNGNLANTLITVFTMVYILITFKYIFSLDWKNGILKGSLITVMSYLSYMIITSIITAIWLIFSLAVK